MAIRIVEDQIRAASGKQEEALQNLSIAAHDAAKYGFVPAQWEARFAHADIELNFGKTASAHAELAALRTDAAGKGFGLIAQKATALMSKKPHGR